MIGGHKIVARTFVKGWMGCDGETVLEFPLLAIPPHKRVSCPPSILPCPIHSDYDEQEVKIELAVEPIIGVVIQEELDISDSRELTGNPYIRKITPNGIDLEWQDRGVGLDSMFKGRKYTISGVYQTPYYTTYTYHCVGAITNIYPFKFQTLTRILLDSDYNVKEHIYEVEFYCEALSDKFEFKFSKVKLKQIIKDSRKFISSINDLCPYTLFPLPRSVTYLPHHVTEAYAYIAIDGELLMPLRHYYPLFAYSVPQSAFQGDQQFSFIRGYLLYPPYLNFKLVKRDETETLEGLTELDSISSDDESIIMIASDYEPEIKVNTYNYSSYENYTDEKNTIQIPVTYEYYVYETKFPNPAIWAALPDAIILNLRQVHVSCINDFGGYLNSSLFEWLDIYYNHPNLYAKLPPAISSILRNVDKNFYTDNWEELQRSELTYQKGADSLLFRRGFALSRFMLADYEIGGKLVRWGFNELLSQD